MWLALALAGPNEWGPTLAKQGPIGNALTSNPRRKVSEGCRPSLRSKRSVADQVPQLVAQMSLWITIAMAHGYERVAPLSGRAKLRRGRNAPLVALRAQSVPLPLPKKRPRVRGEAKSEDGGTPLSSAQAAAWFPSLAADPPPGKRNQG
jgi:hypothetical protein